MELTIVIPTLNRHQSLKKTLQSIVDQQAVTQQYEVIVVDNGSEDDTKKVCTFFESQINHLVYCYDDEPGQLTGRHKGTQLSGGKIISFIDDDVELNPDWINSILDLFYNNQSVAIIGGPCLPRYHAYPPEWLQHFWQPTPYGGNMCLPLSLIDIGIEQLEIDPLYVFGLNYSIRKKTLLDLGGFHPDCIPEHLQKFQGDGETGLSLRAKSNNIKALYSSSALLYHQVPAARLLPEYFVRWYYYNGVCQSFTDIRLAHKLYPSDKAPVQSGVKRIVSRTIRALRKLVRKKPAGLPENILKLQSVFMRSYHEGYAFHQQSFNTDKKVKEWVLKNDYWMYKLPL